MTKLPQMTPDIAQAKETEIRFLVPDWLIEQKADQILVQVPPKFRSDHGGFAREIERIADFISYKNSRDVRELSAGNFRIVSSMIDGSGFVVVAVVQ